MVEDEMFETLSLNLKNKFVMKKKRLILLDFKIEFNIILTQNFQNGYLV